MTTKANCILLNVRGKHYYAEEFGKFIEIEEWEYDRILNNPNLYYFSTALKKHFEWCAAIGKARTLTFSDALGQTHSAMGSAEDETGSSAVAPSSKHIPLLRRITSEAGQTLAGIGLTRSNVVLATLVGVAALLLAYNPGAQTNSSAGSVAPVAEIRPATPPETEIRRAISVEPEIRKAIPVEFEIRRAIPVEPADLRRETTETRKDEPPEQIPALRAIRLHRNRGQLHIQQVLPFHARAREGMYRCYSRYYVKVPAKHACHLSP